MMITRRMALVAAASLAVVAAGTGAVLMSRRTPASGLGAVGDPAAGTPPKAGQPSVAVKDFAIGPADAKVKMIEYASFTCPYCAIFHVDVFKSLKTDYIDTGKLRFEYREFYRNRYDLWAGMLARCGSEMRYFGITAILFETQSEWAASDDPNVVVGNLRKIGLTAGMEAAAVDACLKDGPMAEAMVAHSEASAEADGVTGTPTLIINGTKHSSMSYADLKAILDAELAK